MSENSLLIPISENILDSVGYSSPVLLKKSAISKLYRVTKAGKFFIVKSAKDNSQRLTDIIRREYDISKNLNHPNIVNVFTYEEDPVIGPCIVMEYIDGRDMYEFLRENPSKELRERVFMQVLNAVEYLHRKGIVHNDLKPENILINKCDNSVKLIDFGLSDSDAYFLCKNPGFTTKYASNELLLQKGTDSRSDIYSLGVLMKEFLGSGNARIIGKCINKDKEKRYQNIEQLRKALSHKNYPYYFIMLLICISVMVFVGTGLFVKLKDLNDFKVRQVAEQKMCDSVYNAIDSQLYDIYYNLELSLDDIPYEEFCYLELNKALSELPKVLESFENITANETLVASFISHYTLAQNKYYYKYLSIIEAKPSYGNIGLPDNEKLFYESLLGKGAAYKPYKGE